MTEKHLIEDEVNGALWNSVAVTDPEFTKRVKQGHNYTAITSYYKIKQITEKFGIPGIGWGWERPVFYTQGSDGSQIVCCDVTVWFMWEGHRREIHASADKRLYTQKGDTFDDTHKKALTGAVTKAFSFLGFSADVFMGQHDDDEYVSQLSEHFGEVPGLPNGKEIKPDDPRVKRNNLNEAVKQLMAEMGIDAAKLAKIISHRFNGKSRAKDLILDELAQLVDAMTKWRNEPNAIDALLDEIAIAEGATNG